MCSLDMKSMRNDETFALIERGQRSVPPPDLSRMSEAEAKEYTRRRLDLFNQSAQDLVS
ncbi:MAG: hypothetical protein LBJ14_11125 [Desulfarculales bacterium]|jgi:hypothetical protein|nr:hypothetical protein [Desulfarculales bacterium]